MRLFLDTNVLASAFGTRGLCADLLRTIIERHELVLSESVFAEFAAAMTRKFRHPAKSVSEIERYLRTFEVVPVPGEFPAIPLKDESDLPILASALAARADLFVTGDQELLELSNRSIRIRIVSPRQCWVLLNKGAAQEK